MKHGEGGHSTEVLAAEDSMIWDMKILEDEGSYISSKCWGLITP